MGWSTRVYCGWVGTGWVTAAMVTRGPAGRLAGTWAKAGRLAQSAIRVRVFFSMGGSALSLEGQHGTASPGD